MNSDVFLEKDAQAHTKTQRLITDTLHVHASHLSPLNSADWLCSLLVNGEHCTEVRRELNRLINASSCCLQARQQQTLSVNAWKIIGENVSTINVRTMKMPLRFRWWILSHIPVECAWQIDKQRLHSYTNQWQLITSRGQSRIQEVKRHICKRQTISCLTELPQIQYMSRPRWTSMGKICEMDLNIIKAMLMLVSAGSVLTKLVGQHVVLWWCWLTKKVLLVKLVNNPCQNSSQCLNYDALCGVCLP